MRTGTTLGDRPLSPSDTLFKLTTRKFCPPHKRDTQGDHSFCERHRQMELLEVDSIHRDSRLQIFALLATEFFVAGECFAVIFEAQHGAPGTSAIGMLYHLTSIAQHEPWI